MKKLLLGLMIVVFGVTGGMTYAGFLDDLFERNCKGLHGEEYTKCRDKKGDDWLEQGFDGVGDITRGAEEFNLRMQYYLRAYTDEDLSFVQWKEINGYGSSGMGPLPTGEFKLPKAETFGQIGSNTDFRAFILNVLNWFLSFLGIIAIAVIIFAGYLYVVGGEEQNEKAKKMILYAAIGIIVILSSYALVNTLITKTLEGGDNYDGVQSYVSTEDVIKNIKIVAECSEENDSIEECEKTFHSLGTAGYMVKEYDDVEFYIMGGPIDTTDGSQIIDVQWNFGDKGIYEGEYDGTGTEPHQGEVTRSFIEPGWNKIVVMGRIKKDDPDLSGDDLWNEFVGQSTILIGDIGVAKIKTIPTKTFEIEKEIQFDASASIALAGAIDGYVWTCAPADLCTDFDEQKLVDTTNLNGKQKKDFFASFDKGGVITISLAMEVKIGKNDIVLSSAVVKTMNVQGEDLDKDVDFTVPQGIFVNEEITLVATGAPRRGSYEWEFADGETEEGDRILHTFTETGFEPVILRTFAYSRDEDRGELLGEIEKNVIVASRTQPVAIIALDDEEIVPGIVTEVDRIYGGMAPPSLASLSCDETGACGEGANLTAIWKWNGTIIPEESFGQIFEQLGSHQISLTVISVANPTKKSTQVFTLKVNNIIPSADIVSVNADEVGTHVEIMATDNDGDKKIKQYRLIASQYGKVLETQMLAGDMVVADSVTHNITMIMDLASHLDVGIQKIIFKLEVTDTDGGVRTIVEEFPVEISEAVNNAPTVELFVIPSDQGTTQTVFRFFTQAEDKDGDNLIYTWTFGDETPTTGTDNMSHTFPEGGTHEVTVMVFDGKLKGSDSMDIVIEEDPILINEAPTVSITVLPETGTTNTSFQLTAKGDDPEGDRLTYTWKFPDGSIKRGSSISHTFETGGAHEVEVTAFDGSETGTASTTITVEEDPVEANVAPTVSIEVLPATSGTTLTNFQFIAQGEDANDDALTYIWIFPDGSTRSGKTISYRFTETGTHRVGVTAFDGELKVSSSTTISVSES